MSSRNPRRRFATKQKAELLRSHLKDKVPVSSLCEQHQLQPSVFYEWQARALENLEVALEAGVKSPGTSREQQLEAKIAAMEARLAKKDQVIAEISQEYVTLKKELGEL